MIWCTNLSWWYRNFIFLLPIPVNIFCFCFWTLFPIYLILIHMTKTSPLQVETNTKFWYKYDSEMNLWTLVSWSTNDLYPTMCLLKRETLCVHVLRNYRTVSRAHLFRRFSLLYIGKSQWKWLYRSVCNQIHTTTFWKLGCRIISRLDCKQQSSRSSSNWNNGCLKYYNIVDIRIYMNPELFRKDDYWGCYF